MLCLGDEQEDQSKPGPEVGPRTHLVAKCRDRDLPDVVGCGGPREMAWLCTEGMTAMKRGLMGVMILCWLLLAAACSSSSSGGDESGNGAPDDGDVCSAEVAFVGVSFGQDEVEGYDFVTVHTSTSPDGDCWIESSPSEYENYFLGTGNGIRDVSLMTGGLVVVGAVSGAGFAVPFGLDGATGTQQIFLDTTYLASVAFGEETLVAVGGQSPTNGRFYATTFSVEEIDWASTVTTGLSGTSVAYGNGRFVVADSGIEAAYSDDGGQTWTDATTVPAYFQHMIYANGRFIGVGDSATMAYSDDSGVNWTDHTSHGITQNMEGIAFGNGTLVVVSEDGSQVDPPQVWRSANLGNTWQNVTPSFMNTGGFNYMHDVAFAAGRFVVSCNQCTEGGGLFYSEDGLEWTLSEESGEFTFVLGADL
jgi:hypothetical protein